MFKTFDRAKCIRSNLLFVEWYDESGNSNTNCEIHTSVFFTFASAHWLRLSVWLWQEIYQFRCAWWLLVLFNRMNVLNVSICLLCPTAVKLSWATLFGLNSQITTAATAWPWAKRPTAPACLGLNRAATTIYLIFANTVSDTLQTLYYLYYKCWSNADLRIKASKHFTRERGLSYRAAELSRISGALCDSIVVNTVVFANHPTQIIWGVAHGASNRVPLVVLSVDGAWRAPEERVQI